MTLAEKMPQFDTEHALIDALLADIAVRVQLPASSHARAVDRYSTIRDWIDRDGSPLKGRVHLMYPQGSMATGTTISRHSEEEDFDIDIMVELDPNASSDPQIVLDRLYESIRGEKGSRYFDMTTRNTRCVTVNYADMHLDITPANRIPGPPRESLIFHHKPGAQPPQKMTIPANPYGFAQWFCARTPFDPAFGKAFAGLALNYDERMGRVLARAPGAPVPAQTPAYEKSVSVVALQLIKRWRNVRYGKRDRAPYKRIPSVVLSKFVADNAALGRGLTQELEHQLAQIAILLEGHVRRQQLVHIVNPVSRNDVLTDRWPRSLEEQRVAAEDFRKFGATIAALRRGDFTLEEMRQVLGELFGEKPAAAVIETFKDKIIEQARRRKLRFAPATGAVAAPSVFSSMASSNPIARHNNFGGDTG